VCDAAGIDVAVNESSSNSDDKACGGRRCKDGRDSDGVSGSVKMGRGVSVYVSVSVV